MKWNWNNIFFCLGLLAVGLMLFTFDVSFVELWKYICDAGYWMIPIIGIWTVVYGINALSWMNVIRGNGCTDCHVGFWRIYRLTITGYALNYATPVGGLGGEPYRIMELSKNIDKEHAASSVILYAMMHIFAHFWFWFTSAFLYLALAAIGDLPLDLITGIILAVVSVFCIAAFYIFSKGYRNGFVMKMVRDIGHIPFLKGWSRRFLSAHSESLHKVDAQIAALHRQSRKHFYMALTLEYLSRIVQSAEVMFILLLFGQDCGGGIDGITLTFLHSILIMAFTSLFANLMGFLPLQLGVQEGGFVLSGTALGLSNAITMFVSIIFRVREVVWILIGIMLMKLPSTPPRHTEENTEG